MNIDCARNCVHKNLTPLGVPFISMAMVPEVHLKWLPPKQLQTLLCLAGIVDRVLTR